MIRLEHISKNFGALRALDDVSLEIPPAAITILAGPDGSGKSTLAKVLIGLIQRDSGSILLDGQDIGKEFSRITAIAGYMPERFSLYPDLTVEENLNFFSDIHQVPPRRREEMKKRLLEKTGMLPFKNRRAGALSGGMKQKLALSAILLASPQLIILDEPTTGVDPLSRIEFFAIIEELKQEGRTILISTPYLDEAEKGDYIVFLKNGRILRQEPIDELKRNFPARLFRILPTGTPLAALERWRESGAGGGALFLRGRYLRYLQESAEHGLPAIPARDVTQQEPTLEDIYIYYERHAD